jgi:FixJ family two-component response regulator
VPRDIEKDLEAGFFNYLAKPIKVNQFMDALDVALKFSQTASGRAAKKEQARWLLSPIFSTPAS